MNDLQISAATECSPSELEARVGPDEVLWLAQAKLRTNNVREDLRFDAVEAQGKTTSD
jgi:hypothetical protein